MIKLLEIFAMLIGWIFGLIGWFIQLIGIVLILMLGFIGSFIDNKSKKKDNPDLNKYSDEFRKDIEAEVLLVALEQGLSPDKAEMASRAYGRMYEDKTKGTVIEGKLDE